MIKRSKTYEMVLTAIFGAIILFMSLVPQIGYVTILPGVSTTLVHIPVLVGVFILGLKGGLFLGFFFGLGSLIVSLTYGVTPFDLAFINPLISILPRMLFALIAHYLVVAFKRVNTLKQGKYILFSLVTFITVVALIFGVSSIFRKITYNNYEVANFKLIELKNNEESTEQEINLQTIKVEELKAIADDQFEASKLIRIFIIIIISAVIIVSYYITIIVRGQEYAHVPSVIIISTLIHTILVVGFVSIIRPGAFIATFGGNQNVFTVLMTLSITNGIIEAIIGALIGTPIVVAISKALNTEED